MRKIVGIGLLILTIIYYATSSPKKQDVLTVAYKGQSHDKNVGSRSLKYGRDLDEKESFNQFPKLLELNDRDRLWPPDLSASILRKMSGISLISLALDELTHSYFDRQTSLRSQDLRELFTLIFGACNGLMPTKNLGLRFTTSSITP
jgi:hypothetical protein